MDIDPEDGPVIPFEHSEWEIICCERVMFGKEIPERPWIRHQIVEPKLHVCLMEPLEIETADSGGLKVPHCLVCQKVVPGEVMLRYYWVKGIYEGKRCGAKAVPDGVKITL